jgi:hypothetical protein
VCTTLFLILKEELNLEKFNAEEIFNRINKRNSWKTTKDHLDYRGKMDMFKDWFFWRHNEEKY